MEKNLLYILGLWVVLFFVSGCDVLHIGQFDEGELEFEITYPSLEKGNVMMELYPSKMQLLMKNHDYITNMSAGFGMFKSSYISKSNDKTLTLLVNIIRKKYALTWDTLSLDTTWPELEIEPTGKNKTIAGYVCDEALVKVVGSPDEQFNIYYTDEIERKGSNWDNEFRGIEGFLMEYQMKRFGLEMKFTCTSVVKKEILDSEFINPKDGYEFISEAQMTKIFKDFQ
ncbi:MAG: hypothetical protein HRT71_21250 [Flavobacteriales bacterium]|nr:hypothetical protein [Flavobacteriales bacterium]